MRRLVPLLIVAVLAGCGGTKVEREKNLSVTGAQSPSVPSNGGPDSSGGVHITVITHGQASSPFWAIVRNGVEAAARQMDVLVTYRAPDVYSLPLMKKLIDQAVASHPDGLVVSIPEPGVAPSIKRAVEAGIPVVSINSGSEIAPRLGVLAHVGQPEDRAGFQAGERLARAGVRHALCVNQQVGNVGLDARCRGLERAMKQVGGKSEVLSVNDQSPATPKRIATAVADDRIDGVLALNSTSGGQTIAAVRSIHRDHAVQIGVFDLGPDVLLAVKRGEIDFAVDQQAYLQGYLPIVYLAQRARYGLFPSQGDVVATGPNFVTKANAGKAIELSRRSIR